jgi:hypothetical protein
LIKVLILLKSLKTNKLFSTLLLVAFVAGLCFIKDQPLCPKFETPLPKVSFSVQDIAAFETPNAKLEYQIAKSFLSEKALSPTLFGFKKALALSQTPIEASASSYALIYSYFLAKKWNQLKQLYSSNILSSLDPKAPYYNDALYMFYIALDEEKAPFILKDLKSHLCQDPMINLKLETYERIKELRLGEKEYRNQTSYFNSYKKSSPLACVMNLILPGSGYAYMYQWQSALTAFILLSFLIWALYSAAKHKNYAICFLIFSIFSGFYWGSVVGVSHSVKTYNETLYVALFDPVLKQENLYIEQWIQHAP